MGFSNKSSGSGWFVQARGPTSSYLSPPASAMMNRNMLEPDAVICLESLKSGLACTQSFGRRCRSGAERSEIPGTGDLMLIVTTLLRV